MIRKSFTLFVLSVFVATLFFVQTPVSAHGSPAVKAIDWEGFSTTLSNHANTKTTTSILLNTNKYALTTWWYEQKNFDAQDGAYLSFGGTTEHFIRHPAAMSLGLATSIALDVYDEGITTVSEQQALKNTKKLIASLAKEHKSNKPNGWGDHWQSAHWAYFAGLGGWLIWDEFSSTEKAFIAKMVEYEANRFNSYSVPYWKGENGVEVHMGDTKAEENAWNAQILQLATSMMPTHKNYDRWMYKNIELMISSAAAPSDLTNTTLLHGKSISHWVKGTNINENGTVINHGFVHPDYMEFIAFNNTAGITSTLAGQKTPAAAFFNSDLVYGAYSTVNFTSPPNHSPGGTIYRPNSSDIYYPVGNDWGTDRRMQFATLDSFASVFGYDKGLSIKGVEWEAYHSEIVLAMQNRHEDGRTYASHSEDTYRGREEWVAHHAAWSLLAKWVDASGMLSITNEKVKTVSERVAGSTRYSTAVEISKNGWITAGSVILGLGTNYPDVLAATPFANQKNAPILLTTKDFVPPETINEIKRLKAHKVYILGGSAAISEKVTKTITDLGINVERIGGKDRYETASMLSSVADSKEKVILASGENFPDALSVAALAANLGYPIVLTKKDTLPQTIEPIINNAKEVFIIGGEAVISAGIQRSISNSIRIGGNDRYSTAQKVIQYFEADTNRTLFLANGNSFADALTGSVLAAKDEGVLLLSNKSSLPTATKNILNNSNPIEVYYLGGLHVIDEIEF